MPRQIHLKIPDDLHQALKLVAAAADTTVQDYVLVAIKKRIAADEPRMHEASQSITRIAEEAVKYETSKD